MLVPPATFGARGTSLINTLSNLSLTTGLQGCYDFADSNCYSGSGQTITDLSGNGNNLFNGSSSSNASQDMAFTGTSGKLSAAEYFERNATTGFSLLGGNVPTWMQAVHKSNGKFSCVQWTKTPTGTYGIGSLNNDISIDGAGTSLPPGFSFGASTGVTVTLGYPIFVAVNDAGTAVGYFAGTAVIPNTGTWMFSGCAIDVQAGTAVIQIDSTVYSGAISYSSPSANSAGAPFGVGPTGATVHYKNCLALWDKSIGAAGLQAIFTATRGRFGV